MKTKKEDMISVEVSPERLIRFGKRERSDDNVQLYKLKKDRIVMERKENPFTGKHSTKEELFSILKQLAAKDPVHKIAEESPLSPSTVQRTKQQLEKYIIDKFAEVTDNTGLTAEDIVKVINRLIAKKKD